MAYTVVSSLRRAMTWRMAVIDEKNTAALAVVGVAGALVVSLAGAGAAFASGNSLPTAYWSAASSLSGALVGILVPSPSQRPAKKALTSVTSQLHDLAGGAGTSTAVDQKATMDKAAGLVNLAQSLTVNTHLGTSRNLQQSAQKLNDLAQKAQSQPASASAEQKDALSTAAAALDAHSNRFQQFDWRVAGLFIVGLGAFVAAIWLELKVGRTSYTATTADF